MAQTFPLPAGGSPVPATMNGYPDGALLLATGGTVYASDDGAGQTDPIPVQPGDSLNWPAGRPLWLSATTAGVSAIVEPSGAQLFSASGVASQILAQGLAQDIANDISVTGAPPIDSSDVLFQTSGTIAYGGSWTFGGPPYIDISRYQSVIVKVDAQAGGTTGLNDTFVVTAFLEPSNTAGGNALAFESVECALQQANSSWALLSVPAQGAGLWLGVQPYYSTGAANYATTFDVTVIGSYRTVPNSKFFAQNGNLLGTVDPAIGASLDYLQYGMTVTVPASAGLSTSLSFINAPFDFSYVLTAGTQTSGTDVYISSATPNRQIVGTYSDKTGTGVIQRITDIKTGGRLPRLWMNNKDTVAKTYNLYFAWQR